MRQIIIIGAFLAGLIGLLMSLCGGGFFIAMGYQVIRNINHSGQQDQMNAGLVLLAIPAIFIVCGGAMFWACFRFIRRRKDD